MRYDPGPEICAVLFLITIAVHFFSRPRYPSDQNRFFTAFILIALADVLADIASAYAIEGGAATPAALNWFVNMLLYYCQITLAPLFLMYVLCITDTLHKKYLWHIVFTMLPYAATFICLTVNPVTGVYFYFDKAGVYRHGEQFMILYIGTAFYLALCAGFVIAKRKKIRPAEHRSILIFLSIIVISIIVQLFLPQYLLTGVALSLAVMMMYLTLQNPDDLLDALTGAFNRDSFFTYLTREIAQQKAYQIVAVDIDGMRSINSLFGVTVGDRAFAAAGEYLRRIAGGGRVFRIVGDSLAIVTHSEKDCVDLVHKISDRFDRVWQIDALSFKMSARICYTLNPAQCGAAGDVISILEHALSRVKRLDSGSIMEISEHLQRTFRRSAYVERLLRRALETEAIENWYQPIYCMETGRFSGMEALSRLRDEDGSIVMPGEFIPIAERTGLIGRLGELMIRKTCAFLKESGVMDVPGFEGVSVNLSPAECMEDSLVPKILSAVSEYGVPAKYICFEITETAATVSDGLPHKMDELLLHGFHFALDDFGTGFANYDAVVRLPFAAVKLDKSMLDNALFGGKGETIFSRSLDLINALGCTALVEGVEREEQAAFLKGLGVRYAQGFLYARPMPAEELMKAFGRE